MEEKHPGQTPDAAMDRAEDATAARTRPRTAGVVQQDDPEAARAGDREADSAVDAMKAAGFGSHKGTEAD